MINIVLFSLIGLPLITGLALLFIREEKAQKLVAPAVFFISLLAAFYLFANPGFSRSFSVFGEYSLTLGLDKLARLILIFANLFAFLVCLFSRDYIYNKGKYFSYLAFLLAFTNLEILSADFLFFIFSWGGAIVLLYALLSQDSIFSARKAATILGFSYICFILGAAMYVYFTGSMHMPVGPGIVINQPMVWVAFLLMFIGAIAKAGCGPMHTWIPTASETAPVTVMAILPASLDKLLGIYILSRICMDFFVLNSMLIALLLVIGSLTIIFAVMMALIQHDLRKLLSFHAISQAGYMVLGIGTANPVGIIGAIFHMFNNAIYKNGLFLVGGAVEKKKKTFELDSLGGLARYMPLTFVACLIFSLSISGIPPFNGFASKWMLYQGALQGLFGTSNGLMRFIYCFALVAAMFGSALTLASFVKFLHAIFLGEDKSEGNQGIKDGSWSMCIPVLILAGLCVALGVFSNLFIRDYLAPCFSFVPEYLGSWNSLLVTVLLLGALVLGVVIWAAMRTKKMRQDAAFVGGETAYDRPLFPATEFYKTIEDVPIVSRLYRFIKLEKLDFYNLLIVAARSVSRLAYAVFSLNWLIKPKRK